MAINLAGLANNITEAIKGIGAELGLIPDNSGNLFPDGYEKVTSSKKLEAWNKLPFPYTFSVVDLNSKGRGTPFKDFSLPLAPSAISQTEDFAISVKPTQGGTVTTHSGNRYKTLSIQGTTGVNPFRGLAGVDVTTGKAIAKPDEIKYRSGYEVFQDLRNWFRVYYQYKKQNNSEISRGYRLVFKNFKDGEFLIVELLKFTMDRSAPRSLLYDYKMEFKVIASFNFDPPKKSALENLDDLLNKAVSKIDTARGIFLRTQEILRNIESTYEATVLEPLRKISLAAKALAGIQITAADVGNRIITNTMTAADSLDILKTIREQKQAAQTGESASVPLSIQNTELPTDLNSTVSNQGSQAVTSLNAVLLDIPLNNLPQSTVDAMDEETEDVLTNPRSFYEQTRETLRRVKANAEDSFNLGSDTYDQLFDRTATTVAEPAKQITNDEFDLLNAFNESIQGINQVLSSQRLFKSDFADRIQSITENFVDAIDAQALPAVKQIIMPADTDLEQIALDELSDATRWVEIAELNDLQSPYVVQDQSSQLSNVVKPGDTLLVPQDIIFGLSETPRAKEITSTIGLSEVEKSLGTDLKVDKNFDLALANNGDFAVVSGSNNMTQAIILKLQYEKGELKKDPDLGVGIEIGGKFLSLEDIRDNLVTSLNQDNRIESVTDIQLLRDGPALFMQFNVNIKQVDQPIPLTIKL